MSFTTFKVPWAPIGNTTQTTQPKASINAKAPDSDEKTLKGWKFFRTPFQHGREDDAAKSKEDESFATEILADDTGYSPDYDSEAAETTHPRTRKRKRGRQIRDESYYMEMGLDEHEAHTRVQKNLQRRCTPQNINNGKVGRPCKREGLPLDLAHRQRRRDQYAKDKTFKTCQPELDSLTQKAQEAGLDSLESLLKAAVDTSRGRKMLPNVKAGLVCLENTSRLVTPPQHSEDEKRSRKYLKTPLVANIAAGLQPKEMQEALGITHRAAKRACSHAVQEQSALLPEFVAPKRAGETRKRIHEQEISSTVAHFRRHLHIHSGASTVNTHLLDKPLEEVYRDYRAQYPSFLPNWNFESHGSTMTRTELNQALYNRGFKEVAPWKEDVFKRRKFDQIRQDTRPTLTPDIAKYEVVIDGGELKVTVRVPDGPKEESESDPQDERPRRRMTQKKPLVEISENTDTSKMIHPRSYTAWRDILRLHAPKFKVVKAPYSCDICKQATRVKRQYLTTQEQLNEQQERGGTPGEIARLRSLLADLEAAYTNTLRHEEQMKTQRAYILKREENLKAGGSEVIVYEDFVAQYNLKGKKVANLVFVVIWKDSQGHIQRKYIDNYCTDASKKQDSMFVEHVWQWHLRPNEIRHKLAQAGADKVTVDGAQRESLEKELREREKFALDEFKGVTHILRTGDSGGHFHSR